MKKILFLSTFLFFNLNILVFADEKECGKFDLKCKTKKFIDDIRKVYKERRDILIESFQYVQSDAELIIAGRLWKDNFSKYDQRINSLGLNNRVHKYIRFIPDKERELFFKACDIMVLPYEEVYQSGVLLMGMSYGKAMVVSDLSPFKEVINNNVNGLIFKSLDSNEVIWAGYSPWSIGLNPVLSFSLKVTSIDFIG